MSRPNPIDGDRSGDLSLPQEDNPLNQFDLSASPPLMASNGQVDTPSIYTITSPSVAQESRRRVTLVTPVSPFLTPYIPHGASGFSTLTGTNTDPRLGSTIPPDIPSIPPNSLSSPFIPVTNSPLHVSVTSKLSEVSPSTLRPLSGPNSKVPPFIPHGVIAPTGGRKRGILKNSPTRWDANFTSEPPVFIPPGVTSRTHGILKSAPAGNPDILSPPSPFVPPGVIADSAPFFPATPSPYAPIPLHSSPTFQTGHTHSLNNSTRPGGGIDLEGGIRDGPAASNAEGLAKNLDQYTAFWDAYNKEADIQDRELVKDLSGDLDVLLIFAGLFSATNTAFIIEAYRELKNDPIETTNQLLRTLILNLRDPSLAKYDLQSTSFIATGRAVRVNSLFFASLCCSIFAAFGAVIGKQWVTHYEREGQLRSPAERGRVRQLKYMGLKWWHLLGIVETLPTLLQFSLFFFFAALIDFLWELNITVAAVVITFGILSFLFYVITTTIATISPNSPFQTRFSALLRRLFRPLLRTFQTAQPSFNPKDDTLGSHCIKWLLNTTTVPSTVNIASKAVLMISDTAKSEVGLDEASSVLRYLFKPSIVRGQMEMGASIENVIPSLEELSAMIARWDYNNNWVLPTEEGNALFMRSFRRELLNVFFVNPFDPDAGNCVANILKRIGIDPDTPTPYIDRLFLHVLDHSLQKSSKDPTKYLWDFRCIIGALITIYHPLPLDHLSKLLRIEESQLLGMLANLDTLISVTASLRGYDVQIIHESFRHFITTEERCPREDFLLDPTVHHSDLASKCLHWMLDDLENYTGVQSSSQSQPTIPSHLIYACCYWASHLDQCPMNDPDLLELVLKFCKTMLSDWFEALSHAGRLDVARKSLETTRNWLKNPTTWTIIYNPAASSRMVTRLEMAQRFVSDFYDQIAAKAPIAWYWEDLLMNSNSTSDGFPEVCLEGTRTALLGEIEGWIDNNDGKKPSVLMVQGMIGSGKSAIAQTIVERLSGNGRLLAAIFFRKSKQQLMTHPGHILAALASQMAHHYPGHREHMLGLSRDITLGRIDKSLSHLAVRLRNSIKEALRSEGMARRQSMVIVIDGIDELQDLNELRDILEIIIHPHSQSQLPIKLIITTRPEVKALSTVHNLGGNPNGIQLMDLDNSHPCEADLQHLIRHRLQRTDVNKAWTRMLREWAGTSFIVAATVSAYIADTYPLSGATLFLDNLFRQNNAENSIQMYKQVDDRYLEALQRLSAQDTGVELNHEILASIILLFDTFSIRILSDFLNKPFEILATSLAALRSFLVIQPSPLNTVQLIHPSLVSFLTTRCTDPNISIDVESHHSYLAALCFRHMDVLARDMCDIRDRTKLNWEVDNFSERAEKAVPSHIRYACYHWASHLGFANASDQILVDLLAQFCSTKLLNWLEVLSLFGCLNIAEPLLKRAESWLEDKKPSNHGQLLLLLQDCRRMVDDFFIPMSHCALQIYDSATSLLPDCPLYKTYQGVLTPSAKVLAGRPTTWGSKEKVKSLPPVFSKDGSCVLTVIRGIPTDSFKVWNIKLEEQKAELRSSLSTTGASRQVSLSPNGILVAFAKLGNENAVVVWNSNSSSGTLVNLLGHSDLVNCVGFSADSKQVVSGADDNSVRVWDPDSHTATLTLDGHTDRINVALFSPDDRYIISGSDDCTLLIWGVLENKYVMTLKSHQHPVTCAAVSPDVTRLVSGDQCGGMALWDLESGSQLRTCWGFPLGDPIVSATFSGDGGRIVFRSEEAADFDEFSDSTPLPLPEIALQAQHEASLNKDQVTVGSASTITRRREDIFFWKSGWIMHLNPHGCRKVCWIPSSWHRADLASARSYGNIIAMVSKRGHDIVLLDLSEALIDGSSDDPLVQEVGGVDAGIEDMGRLFYEVFERPPSPLAPSSDNAPRQEEVRSQSLGMKSRLAEGSERAGRRSSIPAPTSLLKKSILRAHLQPHG